MEVFEEPLGESNTERRVQISAGVSKKAPDNIFIIKSQNLKMRGVTIYEILIELMNPNFSKSKILHESSKLEHFQWGVKNFGSTNLGGLKFWTSQKFRFSTIIIFLIFWTGGKNSLDYLVKKYGKIG